MKIRAFSDVHNEIRRSKGLPMWVPEQLPEDEDTILVLAGDIDSARNIPKYLNALSRRFKAVVHVAGNHEYYEYDMDVANSLMSEGLASNVHHLQNSSVKIDGVTFVGSTMWTDLEGVELIVQPRMNDFRYISHEGEQLKPHWVTALHRQALDFLQKTVTSDSIVVSHHSPLSPPADTGIYSCRQSPSGLDYAFYACKENFILSAKPKMWISGHTHDVSCGKFGDTKMICNCVGYPGEHKAPAQQEFYELD